MRPKFSNAVFLCNLLKFQLSVRYEIRHYRNCHFYDATVCPFLYRYRQRGQVSVPLVYTR